MKFIFFGSSKEINLLTHGFDKKSYLILDDVEMAITKAKEGGCLVFINFDFNAEQAKKINDALLELKNIKRIIYSKTRDLRKESIPADEYIMGPLNKASFQNAYEEVMGGKTLSSLTIGPKGSDSDLNKSIQDAFDEAFSQENPEQQAPAAVQPSTPIASFTDEESKLEFTVGGMDLPGQDLSSPSSTPAKETPPEPKESSGMTLDVDVSETAAPEVSAGPGELEIPSMGEESPDLELGGAEDVPAAEPVDQGLDLDLEKEAPQKAEELEQPVQEQIVIPPKPPANLPGASDPSMEFTAVMKQEKEEDHESKEFKFSIPKAQGETKSTEELLAKEPESPKVTPPAFTRAGDDSVVRLDAIIRALRDEREALLKELEESRESKSRLLSENLNLEATTEELKVELAIIKKKNEEEFHEGSYGKKILSEKLRLAEEKNKRLQKDLEILNQKEKIDTNKILQKEKELESQLELLSMDSQNQILIREKKISELKREVDAMEFNMTNLTLREKKLRQEKLEIEEKLHKIMRTMRNSIEFLEEEVDVNQKLFKELKK